MLKKLLTLKNQQIHICSAVFIILFSLGYNINMAYNDNFSLFVLIISVTVFPAIGYFMSTKIFPSKLTKESKSNKNDGMIVEEVQKPINRKNVGNYF